MKVLVLGGAGQLGSEIVRVCEARGDHVRPVTHPELDIANLNAIEAFLEPIEADIVVNCAAFHDVNACEADPAKADAVNTFAMAYLALVCRKRGIKLVHVSTDYVFNGTKLIPYVESDAPKPLQAYGRSKLAGEYAVLGADPANLVVRTASLFGVGGNSAKGGDFPSRIMAAAERDGEVKLRVDLTMSPTYVPDLADGMVTAIHRHMNGILHLAGEEPATWFDVAHECVKAAGIQAKVKRLFGAVDEVPRPKYSVLASERVVGLPAWSNRIEEYLRLWTAKRSERSVPTSC